ncbi:MAG: redoxin domain-containing protein [Planctomycetales bacterium]|nr:redoxin domain-containing protein [Planctomycetales bacterium]NIM09398.1 redoxin domain-containing protein [Planctomycetales bacterium]NIN08872.1 redoxin domain-containing protein [Planctomycetales bacterium]NIN77987.1 redoxin domain-containing protein [Planctomycetales bacterium]NIO35170.1 redoxin domain-containing protein [Planctomycetales bacterium]
MAQLRQAADRVESLGLAVVAVTFESQAHALRYVAQTQWPWPMLVDEDRRLYHAYGMQPGSWHKILGPASWAAYARLIVRGHLPRPPTGDTQQLGGDVVIDPHGTVRLQHVGQGPADRLPIDELLGLVRAGRA